MLAAIFKEVEWQKDYLSGAELDSVYFGGGTPSLLSVSEIQQFFDVLHKYYVIHDDAEITLEANPDDLTFEKLNSLRQTPVNRLSIGVQSFSETDLRFMNRAHTAKEAEMSIKNALDVGFENLTIDLIYGATVTTHRQWEENIRKAIDYEIPHLSSYCLTVEPRTALAHFVKTGKVNGVNDEHASTQYKMLMSLMKENGYDHYEISNFAKPGSYARHNSNYWTGESYLGVGPSAHSFNGQSRQWNVAHNSKYLKATQNMINFDSNKVVDISTSGLFEKEMLTPVQRYNEYVMTSLRTMWGCQLKKIEMPFKSYFLQNIRPFLENGTLINSENTYYLTEQGKLLADYISMELFFED